MEDRLDKNTLYACMKFLHNNFFLKKKRAQTILALLKGKLSCKLLSQWLSKQTESSTYLKRWLRSVGMGLWIPRTQEKPRWVWQEWAWHFVGVALGGCGTEWAQQPCNPGNSEHTMYFDCIHPPSPRPAPPGFLPPCPSCSFMFSSF